MDSLLVILIATYLNVSFDSAKFYQEQGWYIPDTSHLFNTSWVSHGAHVLPQKVPTYDKKKIFPIFFGSFKEFASPCIGQKTSGYGTRWGKNHYGIDLSGKTGDPVYSSFDGVVRYAAYNKGGYGNLVVVRHYNGLETYYAHLTNINVKKDQKIKAGETLGRMGNTGHSFGTHLHFEVRILGYPIDPELIFDFITQKIKVYAYYINSKGIGIDVNKNLFCFQEMCIYHSIENKDKVTAPADTVEIPTRGERKFGNM